MECVMALRHGRQHDRVIRLCVIHRDLLYEELAHAHDALLLLGTECRV